MNRIIHLSFASVYFYPLYLFLILLLAFPLSDCQPSSLLLSVLLLVCPFLLVYFVSPIFPCSPAKRYSPIDLSPKNTYRLLLLAFAIFIFEVIISGGLPLFRYTNIIPSAPSYTEFGIPSLHGFYNSYLFCLFILFIHSQRRSFLSLIPIFLFALTFTRGWISICVAYYLIVLSLKFFRTIDIFLPLRIAFVSFVLSVSFYLFGRLGQIRSGASLPYWSSILDLPFVHAEFEWPYIYLVGSTANALNVIESSTPDLTQFLPWILTKILPSSLRALNPLSYTDIFSYEYFRISESVTTFSFFADIYLVSGPYLSFLLFLLICLYLCHLLYFYHKRSYAFFLLPYLLSQLYISVFSDVITGLPFLFPHFFFIFYYKRLSV